jgi:hypothetical protein
MKNKFKILVVVIAFFCAAPPAFCQTDSNGLSVSAKASLLLGTNEPKLFLTIFLVNTTNREITVSNEESQLGFERNDQRKWKGHVGLHRWLHQKGHTRESSARAFAVRLFACHSQAQRKGHCHS